MTSEQSEPSEPSEPSASGEPSELLHRAGLKVVRHGHLWNTRPPSTAWRPVIAGGTKPTLTVPGDHADLVAEVNRQWHRLAVEHDVINSDGEFLINVAGHNCASCEHGHWTHVRLAEHWDLARFLGPEPGQPEFVVMSLDGESVLGVTTEEYAVWFVAVTPFTDWLDSSARVRVAESPEEREAAWNTVLRCKTASSELRQAWRDGLARNRSASPSVLLRLLDVPPEEWLPSGLIYRQLPDDVVAAWVAHPEWRVRKGLGERWLLSPEQRDELFHDPDPHHRWLLLAGVVDSVSALTPTTYARLADDPSPRVRTELAHHRDLPARHLAALATDPDPEVRRAAVPRAWTHLSPPVRAHLLADPDAEVRTKALLQHHRTTPLSAAGFAALTSDGAREVAARTCLLARELAEELVHGTTAALRGATAQNPTLDPDLVALLGQDPESEVRQSVSVRPELTEAERSRIAFEFDPRARCHPLSWVRDLEDDEEAMRRCATSAHVMLRRSAACATNLPPDVVDLLAHDEDWVVRLFLAEHCAQAPADVLLEMTRSWGGYSTAQMIEHPNFPREGALRYADDPHPRRRGLALLDPMSTAELVERFSRDTDSGVRWRALRDERLSAVSVIRLLDDSHDYIRGEAAADPRLPARVLAALLRDTATATDAATNPTIPEAVMHHLLDQ